MSIINLQSEPQLNWQIWNIIH